MSALIKMLHQAACGNLTADEKVLTGLIEEIIKELLGDEHLVTYVSLFDADRHDWIGEDGVIFYSGQYKKEEIKDDFRKFKDTLSTHKAEGVRTWVFERGNRRYPIILIKKPSLEAGECISYKSFNEILLEIEACDAGAQKLSNALELCPKAIQDFQLIFNYLKEKHFLSDKWQFIYYFVSPVKRHRAVSGASIFVHKAIAEEKLVQLVAYFDVLFAHLDLLLIEAPLRRHALRSAVAAIMARNMSHLLGSHIEPGIQNDLISLVKTVSRSELLRSTKGWPPNGDVAEQIKKVARYGWPQAFEEACRDKDKYNLLELLYRIQQKALDRYALYRQRRMDFIARVATDWPAWGVGFDFYINFVRPFLANSILLHFVGYSDGVHLDWLDFDVYIGGSKVTEQYTPQQGQPIVLSPLDMAVSWGAVESEGRPKYRSWPDGYTPLTVWSRGGDMAVQAFHVILENIIRNSIKHRLKSIKDKGKLRIGIRLFQTYQELSDAVECPEGLRLKASDDLVYVVISSDADCPNKAEELDQKICEPVIKETGEREPGNWGMKEIKIAAAFLGNRELEEVNDPKPDFVQICRVQMPKENGQVVEQLGYCLTLPRFYYVGILKQGAGDVVSAKE